MGTNPKKRHVEKRVVIGRVMGDGDVEAEPAGQQGIGIVPVIILEIPAGLLAIEYRPDGKQRQSQESEQPADMPIAG